MATDPLEPLRGRCLALPEVTERLSHGSPTWFVREKKSFVSYVGRHPGATPRRDITARGSGSGAPHRRACRRSW